jgi:Flp pilus assembly protein TadD
VIRRDLADLATATADVSANTRAVLEAGLLASNGLMHEATRTVAAAVARDPAEPTLYLLLGNLLESSGLNEEAADAFRQARVLLGR